MTPRVDVTFLSMPVTPEAVADAIRDSGHRAFPVALDDELDDVDGVLFVSDLFRSSKGARSVPTSLPDTTEISRKVRRPPLLLPESMGVLEALAEMRARRRTFAVVLDEYGGVAGVATLRDLLEPLVGDLSDEFDEDEEPDFARIDANRWLIDGQAAHRRGRRAPRRRAARGRLRDDRRLPARAARPDPRARRLGRPSTAGSCACSRWSVAGSPRSSRAGVVPAPSARA